MLGFSWDKKHGKITSCKLQIHYVTHLRLLPTVQLYNVTYSTMDDVVLCSSKDCLYFCLATYQSLMSLALILFD